MENNTKENFEVKCIHDRDSLSGKTIMEEFEIKEIVEKWLLKNSFADLMKENGIFRNSQSFGNRIEVYIDTRDGEVRCSTVKQNTMSRYDSFYITLASIAEVDEDENHICEGDEMTVKATADEITETISHKNEIDELVVEKLENAKFEISWWQNSDYIEAEDFVEKLMNESWEDWVNNYVDYILEDVEHQGWEESIAEYYNQLREEREYRSL